jgi:outer membrane lipoprotein-sorting protein
MRADCFVFDMFLRMQTVQTVSIRAGYPASLLFSALFAFSAFSTATPLFAAENAPPPAPIQEARAALEVLGKKHRDAASVSLAFEARALGADGNPMPASKGTMVTADSGRFRLNHAQGTVVCDGVTLWQYFPATKQVVIRPAEAAGGAGGVLLRFLQARAVKADRYAEGSAKNLRVVLDPASVGENLDSLVLVLAPGTSASGAPVVKRVETQDPAGNRVTYTLTSLRYDARPGRAAFTFKTPAGAEVIDMR